MTTPRAGEISACLTKDCSANDDYQVLYMDLETFRFTGFDIVDEKGSAHTVLIGICGEMRFRRSRESKSLDTFPSFFKDLEHRAQD